MPEPSASAAANSSLPKPEQVGNADLALLHAVRSGDPRACATLVRRFEAMVFQLLGRMLRPRGRASDIEDLAQETFLRVFRKLESFDPRGPAKLSTWILTIATRLAINELKRSRASAQPAAELSEPNQNPEQRLTARLELHAAIASMTPEQQAAIVLREFHGLSDKESADILKTSPTSIRARISRGRARLRLAMQKEQSDD